MEGLLFGGYGGQTRKKGLKLNREERRWMNGERNKVCSFIIQESGEISGVRVEGNNGGKNGSSSTTTTNSIPSNWKKNIYPLEDIDGCTVEEKK